jgi:hypothetical protein
LYTVGFAETYWYENNSLIVITNHFGLWRNCFEGPCRSWEFDHGFGISCCAKIPFIMPCFSVYLWVAQVTMCLGLFMIACCLAAFVFWLLVDESTGCRPTAAKCVAYGLIPTGRSVKCVTLFLKLYNWLQVYVEWQEWCHSVSGRESTRRWSSVASLSGSVSHHRFGFVSKVVSVSFGR